MQLINPVGVNISFPVALFRRILSSIPHFKAVGDFTARSELVAEVYRNHNSYLIMEYIYIIFSVVKSDVHRNVIYAHDEASISMRY